MLTQRGNRYLWAAMLALVGAGVGLVRGEDGLRLVHVADAMPAFSLADVQGTVFTYDPNQSRVLGLVFLQVGQAHLARTVTDLETVVRKLKAEGKEFDCVGVMSGSGGVHYLQARDAEAQALLPILLDPKYALWGKLGVVAMPTAVVAGGDHKVRWIKAGYGYDFIPNLHAQMAQALGLDTALDVSIRVETLENTSSRARMERHLQMARTLAKKGRLEMAISELQKVRELDPNAVEAALDLGELFCRAGRSKAALEIAAEAKVRTNQEKARALLISGWARREMGELDVAESLLSKAMELDHKSSRALYELGKIWQARGDMAQAAACYRKALAEVFADTEDASNSR